MFRFQDIYDSFEFRTLNPRWEDFATNSPHFHISLPRRQKTSDSQDDPDNYHLMLNVKHFRPDEVEVKIAEGAIVIRCRHEEQADEHGFVSREFTRRHKLPKDVDPTTLKSNLSHNGVLTIKAPRKRLDDPKNERIIPITVQQPMTLDDQNLHFQGLSSATL